MTKIYLREEDAQQANQKAGYMSQLDEWTNDNVVFPLSQAFEAYGVDADNDVPQEEAAAKVDRVVAIVQKAIREKVLESYHNGQKSSNNRPQARPGQARSRYARR
jgi:hypothetical protein